MQRSTPLAEEAENQGLAEDLTGQTLDGTWDVLARRFHSSARSQYSGRNLQNGGLVTITVFPGDVGRSDADGRNFAAHIRELKELNHPGIPQLLEAGVTEDGRRYVVHRQVDGRTLRDVIKADAPLGPDRAAQILMKAARVMAVARAGGMMHGNLKPENLLLVVTPNDLESVVIQDLGVGRLMRFRPGARQGGVSGTPRYMAPEQVTGNAEEPRSDVYALGIIAYEMLTGKVPYPSDNPDEVMKSHLTAPVPPVKTLDPHNSASTMFEQLLLKMLSKKPEARPSPADLVEEVDILPEYLETEGAPPRVDGPSDVPGGAPNRGTTGRVMPHILVDRTSAPPTVNAFAIDSDHRPSTIGPAPTTQRNLVPFVAGGGVALAVAIVAAVVLRDPAPNVATPTAVPVPAPAAAAPPEPTPNDVDVDLTGMKLTRKPGAPAPARPAPAAGAPSAGTPDPNASRLVTITVTSTPAGAAVFDGPIQRGTTPASLVVPRGEAARTLRITLEGHAEETRQVTPSDNVALDVALKPTGVVPPPEAPPVAAEPVAKPAPVEPAAVEAAPVAEKPAAEKPVREAAPEPPPEEKAAAPEPPAPASAPAPAPAKEEPPPAPAPKAEKPAAPEEPAAQPATE